MRDLKAEARRQIKDRIDFYENGVKVAKTEGKYSEADVETKFIDPFLKALGWDPSSNEVKKRYPIGRKIVDYALQIGDVGREPNVLVEVKSLVQDLDGKEWDEDIQDYITYPEKVVGYAWRSRVNWAILTNFKELRVYNVGWSKIPEKALWFSSTYDKFLDDKTFERIWAISREGVATGILDTYDTKTKRKPVDRQFLEDLVKCRRFLIDNIRRRNKKLKPELLKECTQRILDRLVIMRAAEDLRVEKADLLRREIVKEKGGWDKLKQWLFRNFDKRFNSRIFAKHPCDDLEIDDEVIQTVVDILYNGTGESSGYRFDEIHADMLGAMYEDYIGYILKEEGEIYKLEKKMEKRKAGGIYYTPTYVVEFIVENTLGTLLKDMRPSEVKNIHILDPACGSGSFLTKAQDVLKRYYDSTMEQLKKKEGEKIDLYISKDYASLSKDILTENIYGVDLDSQAAEIASVNLSLKVLADMKKEMKLPEVMGENIKVGNSLISNHRQDLKKYFEHPAAMKPFNWDEEFLHVFDQGGFDVVIGNPPYVRQESITEIKPYLEANYETFRSTADLFVYFIERSLKLLKPGGYFGFIVSSQFTRSKYGDRLRDFLKRFTIEKFVYFGDLPVFGDATTYPCIIIIKKQNPPENHKIEYLRVESLKFASLDDYFSKNSYLVEQKNLSAEGWEFICHDVTSILNKIKRAGKPLEEMKGIKLYRGVLTGLNKAFIIDEAKYNELVKKDPRSSGIIKPFISGRDMMRYSILNPKLYLIFTKHGINIDEYPAVKGHLLQFKKELTPKKPGEKIGRKPGDYKWYEIQDVIDYYKEFEKPKIIFRGLSIKGEFPYAKEPLYVNAPASIISNGSPYLSAILHSKLIWFVIINTCPLISGEFRRLYNYKIEKLPIVITDKENYEKLSNLANEMSTLSKGYYSTLDTFHKILDNIKDSKTKLKPFGKYYFKEGSAYGIDLAKTKKLIDTNLGGKVTAIEVEDEGESLVLNAKYGDKEDFVSVIRIHIKDNELRKFFYYTMKIYLMEKVKTRMWGEGKIIDVVLNALEIPRFETNIEMDKGRIRKLMSEFFKSSPIKDKSLSEVGKEIQRTDSLIDQKVYGLYGITDSEKKIIEESLQ